MGFWGLRLPSVTRSVWAAKVLPSPGVCVRGFCHPEAPGTLPGPPSTFVLSAQGLPQVSQVLIKWKRKS